MQLDVGNEPYRYIFNLLFEYFLDYRQDAPAMQFAQVGSKMTLKAMENVHFFVKFTRANDGLSCEMFRFKLGSMWNHYTVMGGKDK